MSYRQAFYGLDPALGVEPMLAGLSRTIRDHRPDLRVQQIYLRSLGDEEAREAGVRWTWIAVDASHGGVFTREAIDESLRDRVKDLVAIVHDDQRGAYAFACGELRLSSLSGVGDAPNAVVLGLQQRWPEASTKPMAYLQLLTKGVTHRFEVRDPGSPVLDEAPPPLAGYVDPTLEVRTPPPPSQHAMALATALDAGSLDQARARAWDWTQASPRDPRAWEAFVDVYLRRGERRVAFEELIEGVQQGCALDALLARVRSEVADANDSALLREIDAWTERRRQRPPLSLAQQQEIDALLDRAERHALLGSYPHAITCAADVLALVPDEPRAWKRLIAIQSRDPNLAATFARVQQAASALGEERGTLRWEVSRILQRADRALLEEVVAWTKDAGIRPRDLAHYEKRLRAETRPRPPAARGRWTRRDYAMVVLGLFVAVVLALAMNR